MHFLVIGFDPSYEITLSSILSVPPLKLPIFYIIFDFVLVSYILVHRMDLVC